MGVAVFAAAAQTQVDLRTQTKNVDFRAATSTKPIKTGTALPATCAQGEMFFKTDAPAGSKLYGCAAENRWEAEGEGLTVQSDGVAVGMRPRLNLITGPGLISLIADNGSAIDVLFGLDTAVTQTRQGEQSGAAVLCAPTGHSSSNYQCALHPTAAAYQTGMVLRWKPDVNGAGGATTLNVDTLGQTPVKLRDGVSDPAATDIVAGQLYEIWYDGAQFRLMTPTAAATGAIALQLAGTARAASCGYLDYGGTLTGGRIMESSVPAVSSSATVDIWIGPTYQPTVANSIIGSGTKPTLSASIGNSVSVANWTTAFSAGNYMWAHVDTVTEAHNIQVALTANRN